ncbi:lysylphosphatidylglycerol synthase transmembrane domain-containing protein [Cellulomonas soli]|uniref:Integral membrane protein n=1 Tax=Cellulomonas soli TaxID=931535 RepID=A0A512P8H5_9CELL|nr:lysylphosphatidylglycerol synthase transmembrane domain-containing protein [Cellulomonas soli]NYI57725.1 uncharacterized membrane protein YbhN (UPF0104 family) [Cellulomonas soli]GEP67506.1 hypothetical protein CSO01_02210 [Cellulomonas soli]
MAVRRDPSRPPTAGLVRLWSSAADAPRLRRPTDVLLLAASVLTLGLLALAAPGPTDADRALDTLLAHLEPLLGRVWSLAYAFLALWAAAVVLLTVVSRGRRGLLVDQATAAALALGAALGTGALAGTAPADGLDGLLRSGPPAVYVATRVAVITAVVVTASPHLARPWRYTGRFVVGVGALAAIGLGATHLIGAGAAIAVGVGAAALTHLALGSPQGRLTPDQVRVALADLGVVTTQVTAAPREVGGRTLLVARTDRGADLRVEVFGRDAWDSQVVGSLWTALTRRGERPHLGSSRRTRVEHEALMTLMAARSGVPVLDVIAVGLAAQGDALLVTSAPSASLDELGAARADDDLLSGAWRTVLALHGVGTAHGRIDGRSVVVRADGTAALTDLDSAVLNAEEGELHTDRARLLVTTALVVGPERALHAAVAAVGADGLAQVLPYLQPAALGRETRGAVRAAEWSLEDLRSAAVVATGVQAPPLERLRRVTPRSIGTLALVGLIAYLVVTLLAGADLASVAEALRSADPAWLVAALLLSPFIQASLAVSTMGSTTARLRYVPVLMLQYAIGFLALVLPATAARLALEVRFFQRFGIAAGTALTFGVIDSVSGFTVQVALVLLILVSGLPGFTSSLGTGSDTSSGTSEAADPSLVAVLVALVLLGAVVTVAVPRLRRGLVGQVPRVRAALAEQARSAHSALGVLRKPAKLGAMLGGNLGAQLLQAAVLALCLHAFGQTAHFSQLVLINTAVSLFAGVMPVPGGMGVAEAGFTLGLQAIGVPSAIAVSTAITFRLVTFYLPPIWGSAAMRWLRRHEYV